MAVFFMLMVILIIIWWQPKNGKRNIKYGIYNHNIIVPDYGCHNNVFFSSIFLSTCRVYILDDDLVYRLVIVQFLLVQVNF